jgi:GPH family glycoside/pentoside/hexuronide:cation symporter/glucuronide carrier protein
MRSEASMGAISTFVTKLGGGIGGALPGYMLALTGYIPDVDTQPAAVYSGIIIMSLLVPAVCYLLGLIIFKFGYNVDFKEVSAALAERRAQGNKTDFS